MTVGATSLASTLYAQAASIPLDGRLLSLADLQSLPRATAMDRADAASTPFVEPPYLGRTIDLRA